MADLDSPKDSTTAKKLPTNLQFSTPTTHVPVIWETYPEHTVACTGVQHH